MDIKTVSNKRSLIGEITIPADKSLTHRAIMVSLLAKGKYQVDNFLNCQDCLSTLQIVKDLGVEVEFKNDSTLILNSKKGIHASLNPLNAGNSGTTMRLMSGILAGQNFNSEIFGDESLSKRPMKRIITPLTLMGAKIESNNDKAPLKIYGGNLNGIEYKSPVASAQVKSAILFAGLKANGSTTIIEPYQSRNHTELLLKYLGADITENSDVSTTVRYSELEPKNITVAGDISSAAFFMAAASITEGSDIKIKNVGLNPTRTGMIDVLERMGADIQILNEQIISGEKVGTLDVKYSKLKGTVIQGTDIPRLIDEIPVIAVMATQAEGKTIIKDAGDLRNKESDRIKAIVNQLKKLGANIEETPDGMIIEGKTDLKGDVEIETFHDHRIGMSFYVAGLITKKPLLIKEFQWVNISFPEFLELMNKLY